MSHTLSICRHVCEDGRKSIGVIPEIMEDQIQFPTPTFDDCFEQYLDEDNVRRIVPSVRVFSPVWKRCVPLVQTVRHAKGKTVQTLNLADVHELLTQHDENLVYPDSDVESRVWKEYRLLRVDYTTRKVGGI